MKAFTTFGVGATAADAFERPMQPLPLGITDVQVYPDQGDMFAALRACQGEG